MKQETASLINEAKLILSVVSIPCILFLLSNGICYYLFDELTDLYFILFSTLLGTILGIVLLARRATYWYNIWKKMGN